MVFYFLLSAFYFFQVFVFFSVFFLYLTFDSFYKHLYPVNINFLSAVFNYKAINVKLAPKLNYNPQLFMKYQLISSHPNPPQNSINQNDDNLTLKLTFYQRTPLYPKFWVIILVCFICYYFGFNPKKCFVIDILIYVIFFVIHNLVLIIYEKEWKYMTVGKILWILVKSKYPLAFSAIIFISML